MRGLKPRAAEEERPKTTVRTAIHEFHELLGSVVELAPHVADLPRAEQNRLLLNLERVRSQLESAARITEESELIDESLFNPSSRPKLERLLKGKIPRMALKLLFALLDQEGFSKLTELLPSRNSAGACYVAVNQIRGALGWAVIRNEYGGRYCLDREVFLEALKNLRKK